MCSRGMRSENLCEAVGKKRKLMQTFCKTML